MAALLALGIAPAEAERMLDRFDAERRYAANAAGAAWANLAFVQAISYEGDTGQLSSAYTWESAWALSNPAPDDLARETA